MTEAEIKHLMTEFSRVWRAGDADGCAALLADDFVWRLPTGSGDPQGRVLQGREAVRAYLRGRFAQDAGGGVRFSDSRTEVFGDALLLHYRVQGTGENGERIDAMGLDLFRFADGKLVLKDAYWKQVAWPAQP